MLIVMDKSNQEEHFSQPVQTNNEQLKIAVTFITVYNGRFNVTNSNFKFYLAKVNTDKDGFDQLTILPGAYKIENLNI